MWSEHHCNAAPRELAPSTRGCTGRALPCQGPRGAGLLGLEVLKGISFRALGPGRVSPHAGWSWFCIIPAPCQSENRGNHNRGRPQTIPLPQLAPLGLATSMQVFLVKHRELA